MILLSLALAQTYEDAPAPISDVLDAPSVPATSLSPTEDVVAILERPGMPDIAAQAAPILKLAGVRIDPRTFGPARSPGYAALSLLRPGDAPVPVDLPEDADLHWLSWHPSGERLSVVNITVTGAELWVVETATGEATRLVEAELNATYGNPCDWLAADEGLLCKIRTQVPPPSPPVVPEGPLVEESLGRTAGARTYADLLETPHDEDLFVHYLTSAIDHVALDGTRRHVVGEALVDEVTVSPDGDYAILETLHAPFSTQVPASRFPKRVDLLDWRRSAIAEVVDLPLADDIPTTFGSVRAGPRSFQWRADAPATLVWFEAQDGGDAGRPAAVRDAPFAMDAPFRGPPVRLFSAELRLSDVTWGDGETALVEEWWDDRTVRTWSIAPDAPEVAAVRVHERNYQDAYADPGNPLTVVGPYGARVLQRLDGDVLLAGDGASDDGVYPFLDRLDVQTGETRRLWQAQGETYERVVALTADGLVTRGETVDSPPNLILRTGRRYRRSTPITTFADPLPLFAAVGREELAYTREDGVTLTASLYTPPGWTLDDGPLPTLVWAYPREHKSRDTAGQKTRSDFRYTRPAYTSARWLALRGYAVLENPAMPIIGEGDAEPNDTYVAQLVAGADAAVSAVVDRGVADPDRVAIGGHSYGAFTAANLLAHSDLFACGIARSGAYNRSLTPFGFQGEQRTYWEATDTYQAMSPFTQADLIDEPLLLIHGDEDNNSGTWPMQSERLYEALRGLGGSVRYVVLPHEAHGYVARQSVGHVLWEMDRWLSRQCTRAVEQSDD